MYKIIYLKNMSMNGCDIFKKHDQKNKRAGTLSGVVGTRQDAAPSALFNLGLRYFCNPLLNTLFFN